MYKFVLCVLAYSLLTLFIDDFISFVLLGGTLTYEFVLSVFEGSFPVHFYTISYLSYSLEVQ